MKKTLLLVCSILLGGNAFGQWTTTNLSEGKASMGAAAYGSKIYSCGGVTLDVWEKQNPNFPPGDNLFGLVVSIVDENTAWMAPNAGDISVVPWSFGLTQHHFSRTTDGGQTWIPGTYPTSGTAIATSIFALNDKVAWLTFADFVEGPKLLKTADGGQNWTSINPGLTTFPDFVHFFDVNNGILACDADTAGHTIFRTSDGGNSWQRIDPANLIPAVQGDGIFPWNSFQGDHVWVQTLYGNILHSSNKGVSWESWGSPLVGVPDYFACQDNTCLASYGDYSDTTTNKFRLFRTKNKGADWEEITPVDNHYAVNGMKYVPHTKTLVAAFVGHNVTGPFLTRVSYDDGTTWQTIDDQTKVLTLFFYDEKTGYGTHFNNNNSPLEIYRYIGDPLVSATSEQKPRVHALSVQPNPTTGTIKLNFSDKLTGDYLLTVSDVYGRVIQRKKLENMSISECAVDLSGLPPGPYMLNLSNEKGRCSAKVLKQ